MPEGPELHLAGRFINHVCRGRVFGQIVKSEISKNPVVTLNFAKFSISASSRGKELKITLTELPLNDCNNKLTEPATVDILFTFGLAGKFDFMDAADLQKHAHLNFFTSDNGPKKVLSYIDYMRFGKWTPNSDFSYKERGPCTLLEYGTFRENVLQNVNNRAFNKPICEALLNQKFFNGIGNYLRAEILYRANIPPFVSARSVLEPLAVTDGQVKPENPDILQLCSLLPNEVVHLEASWYDGKDRADNSNSFNNWLQCYYQVGMKNAVDHNKRTIWYDGPLGPMAPKDGKVRGRKVGKKSSTQNGDLPESETGKSSRKGRKRQSTMVNQSDDIEIKPKRIKKETGNVKKKMLETNDTKEEELPKRHRKRKTRNDNEQKVQNSSDKMETVRLTRGKMKEVVDKIGQAAEKNQNKKSGERTVTGHKSIESPELQLELSAHNETDDKSGMKARTKRKARSKIPLQNDAVYLNSSKNEGETPRKLLKTTRAVSRRRSLLS